MVIVIYAIAAVARAQSDRRRLVAVLAGATLLAFALAAVQILPALAHARQSPRALGVTWSFASSYAWPSWRYVLTLFTPTLYGDDARGTYVGAPDQWELCGYGIGVIGYAIDGQLAATFGPAAVFGVGTVYGLLSSAAVLTLRSVRDVTWVNREPDDP